MWILKLSGVTLLMLSSLMTGLEMRRRLSCRVETLRMAEHMLTDYLSYIGSGCFSLPVITEKLAPKYPLCSSCAEKLSDEAFESAFCGAVNEEKNLGDEERQCLIMLAASLGKNDLDSQSRLLNSAIDSFGAFIKKAETRKEQKSGLYMKGSLLVGAFAAILLI